MRIFEGPEMEIVRFVTEDIITTSGREDELPLNCVSGDAFPIVEID